MATTNNYPVLTNKCIQLHSVPLIMFNNETEQCTPKWLNAVSLKALTMEMTLHTSNYTHTHTRYFTHCETLQCHLL